MAHLQRDRDKDNSHFARAKHEEVSALRDECKTLAELVQKRDRENSWLHKRTKQIQGESDDALAAKVDEKLQSYSKDLLSKDAQIKKLNDKVKLQARIIRSMNNHMVLKGASRSCVRENSRPPKRRASAAGLDTDACLRWTHRNGSDPAS